MLQAAHHNASVYLHAVFARPGSPTSPREQDFDPEAIFWKTHGGQSEAALLGCHCTMHRFSPPCFLLEAKVQPLLLPFGRNYCDAMSAIVVQLHHACFVCHNHDCHHT